jgi:hypothetical protein
VAAAHTRPATRAQKARILMDIKLLATDDEASALASTEMLHD